MLWFDLHNGCDYGPVLYYIPGRLRRPLILCNDLNNKAAEADGMYNEGNSPQSAARTNNCIKSRQAIKRQRHGLDGCSFRGDFRARRAAYKHLPKPSPCRYADRQTDRLT